MLQHVVYILTTALQHGYATEEAALHTFNIPLCAVQKQGCVLNTPTPRHPHPNHDSDWIMEIRTSDQIEKSSPSGAA
jgi:hypothetical protein